MNKRTETQAQLGKPTPRYASGGHAGGKRYPPAKRSAGEAGVT